MSSGSPATRTLVYLDDLQVGQKYVTGTYQLDEQQIKQFASQYDPQPFHLDADAGSKSLFQGLVASGWHTAAVTMRLMVESGIPIAGGLIGAGAEISWPRPTRPGSIVHVESEVLEIKLSKSRPDRGIVTVRNETKDQTGEVVQVMTAKMIVSRKPSQLR